MGESRLGRPTREAAAGLAGRILDAATSRFLSHGYAATSMEAIAAAAGVSKRTLYKRHPDKAALLRAAITRMIEHWLPGFDQALVGVAPAASARDASPGLERALIAAARSVQAATLSPEALALYRLLVAESGRFPEIGQAVEEAGITVGIARVAALLRHHAEVDDPLWAAEQFQRLVMSGPQWRALGFGAPLTEAELDAWARRCVAFFLRAIGLSVGLAERSERINPSRHAAGGDHHDRTARHQVDATHARPD